MLQAVEPRSDVAASLSFAASRAGGGIWSNSDRNLITQELSPTNLRVADMRALPAPASLEREGFEVRHDPLADIDWSDNDWIGEVYAPHCIDMVKRRTGAAHAVSFYGRDVLIRDTRDRTRAPAAEFVHLDQTRASAQPFFDRAVDPDVRARYPRVRVYNVWRAITPPPQDVPLALCDQRTVNEADWVVGRTVEPNFPDGVPYLTSVHNPAQRWYYHPALSLDDVVLFKGYDSDPAAPMGCLHGAFRRSAVGLVPRASAEFRVTAFFAD